MMGLILRLPGQTETRMPPVSGCPARRKNHMHAPGKPLPGRTEKHPNLQYRGPTLAAGNICKTDSFTA